MPTSWRITPTRPSIVIVPAVGVSSPATRRMSVDFPTPLAPTSAARSPSPTLKLTSARRSAPPGSRQPRWLTWIEPTDRTLLTGTQREGGSFGQPQDVAQRAPEGGGRRSGVVVLGLGAVAGELDPHRVARDVDGDVDPPLRPAHDRGGAHAEAASLGQHHRG